jgi:glycosyltransferase involved in cell wall biosynthesis
MTNYFSIVIPTLNEEKNISNLLNDLINQDMLSFDVTVVDGSSDDRTIEIAQSYASQLRLQVVISKDRNPGIQRNLGVAKTDGKYLVFLDADIRVDRSFLDTLMKKLSQDENIDFAATFISPDTNKLRDIFIAYLYNFLIILKPITQGAVASSFIIKRSVFIEIGGFDPELVFGEDRDLIKRLLRNKRKFAIFHNPRVVWSFRRFRAFGYTRTMIKLAHLNFVSITKGDHAAKNIGYEMGGTLDEKASRRKKSKRMRLIP